MSKKKKISIIGLGYVGLPMAIRFTNVDFDVVGYDEDPKKVSLLRKSQSYLSHISQADIDSLSNGNFYPTTDESKLADSDAILICVPTPLNKFKEPDMSYINSAMDVVKKYLKRNLVICLVSTTYPGTCEEIILPELIRNGYEPGKDIFLTYSPEREDPGNQSYNFKTTPRIIGGYSKKCLAKGTEIFAEAVDTMVEVSSLKTAEMVKLLENIYRSVNIGLVNEIKKITDKMGIDVFEVIDAAASKPFGFKPFYPGPGLGGHCIPIDPFYLSWKAKEYDLHNHFIELAGEINTQMPSWVTNKISQALNQSNKPISKSKILLLGIAYKKNIDDCRESPGIKIFELLTGLNARVGYVDPFVGSLTILGKVHSSKKLTKQTLENYDASVLVTNHDNFDYKLIKKHSKLIIDTRGVYKNNSKKIYRA